MSTIEVPNILRTLTFFPDRGELRSRSGDVIVVSGAAFRALFYETTRHFRNARAVWLQAGKAAGMADAAALGSAKEGGLAQDLEFVSKVYSGLGWGSVRITHDYKLRRSEIVIENSATSRGQTSDEPSCWFIVGFMEGLFSGMFRTEARCNEVACAAKGAPHCEFVVYW